MSRPSPPHVIRLRTAWRCEWPADGSRLLFRRRFGCPTGLDLHTRVMLVIQQSQVRSCVTLNGGRLGWTDHGSDHTEFDIGDRLERRNALWLDVDPQPNVELTSGQLQLDRRGQLPTLLGQVWLEIRGPVTP